MKTVKLPSGESVAALGLGTWRYGEDRSRRGCSRSKHDLAELDRLFPPPEGPRPLEML